jgi:hypothetical protein
MMLLWGRRCLAQRYSAPRRKLSLLPLDDCLYALQATIPHLTRSSLHRLFHTATAVLNALIAVVPYKIHTILTDNGIQFCDLPKNRLGPTARCRTHMFDLLCRAHGIEHRLTKLNHPWTNGQVERLKEATVPVAPAIVSL